VRSFVIMLLLCCLWVASAQATVYRCEDPRGMVVFSDEPCGDNAEIIDLGDSEDAGASSDTEREPPTEVTMDDLPAQVPTDMDVVESVESDENPCLRDYHATYRGEIDPTARGVDRTYIIEHCGPPDEIVRTDDPQTDEILLYYGPDTEIQLYMSEGKVLWRGRVAID